MAMLTGLSTNKALLCVLLTAITYFILAYVIIPLTKLSFYKKKGFKTYFFPILGPFHLLGINLKEKNDAIAGEKEFSKNFPNQKFLVSHIGSNILFSLRDVEYIKEFLQNQNPYEKSAVSYILKPLLGDGLVLAEGETWKRHRKLISNSFHYEFLKSNVKVIQETTQEFLAKISSEEYKDYAGIGKIEEITGEIVGRIFFGKNLNNYTFEGKTLPVALAAIIPELGECTRDSLVLLFGAGVLNLPFIPKYRRILQKVLKFRKVCMDIIQERKERPQWNNDLLEALLATQSSEDPDQRFSDENIINEFITFFVAGMDTTGHLIGMTLYNLAQYPHYLKELKEERDMTYNTEKVVTAETLQNMNVLHSILKETLRFYSPATGTFIRTALRDHKLLDLEIKKGDLVQPGFYTPCFDEKHFKNPEDFKPEIWRDPTIALHPYAFTPFSAGPRNCIGQHLAIMKAKVIVSEFLERFTFKLKEGYKLRMTGRFLYEPEQEPLFDLVPIIV